ncbi:MAG: type II secretion system F family protein [Chloroflexi bacterium]|nr:type II secretion system F family protein [Chloroflexota bacterium]
MDPMLLLLSLFFGLSVIFIFIGLAIPSGPTREQERLQTYGSRPRTLTELEMSQPFSDRVLQPLVRGTSGFFSRFTPKQNVEEMKRKIELAGNPNNWTAADFLGVRGLGVIITAILVGVPMLVLRIPWPQTLLFTAIAAFLGFYLPMFWLSSKIRQRQHDIQKALPDALDLLTICTEAGQGFDAAMAKVAEKWDNELSHAFARANAEVRLGKIRREALRDMANRADVPNLTNFIAAVIQADQLGVSMAKVLRIQSEQMRVKRRQHAEELAAKAPVKMMFPLVFLIFPSIMIVLLGPAVLIFTTGGGFGVK